MPDTPPPPALLLCFEDEATLASAAAAQAGMDCAVVQRHRFPDGELKLRLPPALPPRVTLWRSLHQPNEKLVELLLAAQTARSLGARHLSLVAPYLAYMRQDMAFNPGEAVSQRVVGGFLGSLFDAVITVDPHLHRIHRLQEAIPVPQAVVLSGAPLLAHWIARHHADPLLVGPDSESYQWVASAAAQHGWAFAVAEKQRHGDHAVSIALPAGLAVSGRHVVLMDDVASSGRTLIEAARHLFAQGARSVDVAVTHALFAQDALAQIRAAGIDRVWSTDCIAHPSNAVSIVPQVAQTLRELAADAPALPPEQR